MTTPESTTGYADDRLMEIGVRRLNPDNTRIFLGEHSLLHCAVQHEDVYRGVFAVRMFPISCPDNYISLRYIDLDDKEQEIGIIEDASLFPADAQEAIHSHLLRQYYERTLVRIFRIEYRHNVLFFDVETTEGRTGFTMWWAQDQAQEYGSDGKVLLDTFENRYIIPDVSQLPPADQRTFLAYIYW